MEKGQHVSLSLKRRILFRVDGGKVWGVAYGHIKRCLLLAEPLRFQNEITFVMKNYPDGIALVKEQGYKVIYIPTDDDSDTTFCSAIYNCRPHDIVVDLATCPYVNTFEEARNIGIRTIVFDIMGCCTGRPNFIINDSIVGSFTSSLSGKADRCLLGPAYFIMERPSCVPLTNASVHRIMVTMGGADPAGLTAKVLSTILPYTAGLDVTVVLGPSFTEHAIIEKIAEDSSVHILRNPRDFIGLLATQDVVISAGGRTLYECAHLGRPTVVVPSIEHEYSTAEAFSSSVGFPNVGLWDDLVTPTLLLEALKRYREDSSLRNHVRCKGTAVVDGNGLRRIIEILWQQQ